MSYYQSKSPRTRRSISKPSKILDFQKWYSKTSSTTSTYDTATSDESNQAVNLQNSTRVNSPDTMTVFERLYAVNTSSSKLKRAQTINRDTSSSSNYSSPKTKSLSSANIMLSPDNSIHHRLSVSPTVTSKTKAEHRVKRREEVHKKVETQRKARNGELIPNHGPISPLKADSMYYRGMLDLVKKDITNEKNDPNFKSKINIDQVLTYSKKYVDDERLFN